MDVGDVTAWASSVDTQAGLDGSGTHMDSPVFEDVKVGLSASITWKTSYTLASVLGGIYIFGPATNQRPCTSPHFRLGT